MERRFDISHECECIRANLSSLLFPLLESSIGSGYLPPSPSVATLSSRGLAESGRRPNKNRDATMVLSSARSGNNVEKGLARARPTELEG